MYMNNIGINAGDIFCLLADNGTVSIREIEELTHYKETFILLALGWLARENKVRFFEEHDEVYVELYDCRKMSVNKNL
jgi:hypothetical protein